jgi:hypothetical protein
MTYTRGSRYSFWNSWGWALWRPKHVEFDVAVNKFLRSNASSWSFLLILNYDARNDEFKIYQTYLFKIEYEILNLFCFRFELPLKHCYLKVMALLLLEVMESNWNLLASLGHRWRQHVTVRGFDKHCIATEVTGFRNVILIISNHVSPFDPTTPFKPYWRRFIINVAFAMTIDRAQGQTLQLDGPIARVFPMPSSIWHCPDHFHLTTSLFHLFKGFEKL